MVETVPNHTGYPQTALRALMLNNLAMEIGSLIKRLRKRAGYKQIDFAQACSISPSYLSQIENDTRLPHKNTLKVISRELKIPVPILFFLTLDIEDIPKRKRAAYEVLYPSLRAFILEMFPAVGSEWSEGSD